MRNIKIERDGEMRSYVNTGDLEDGKEIIYFGNADPFECDISDTDETVERNIEGIITHESLHIVIYQTTKLMKNTVRFDNLDNADYDWPVSGDLFSWL